MGTVGSETSRAGTTLGMHSMQDSIECLRLVTFTLSLTGECNFVPSLAALTRLVVESTIGDNGATGDEGKCLVEA